MPIKHSKDVWGKNSLPSTQPVENVVTTYSFDVIYSSIILTEFSSSRTIFLPIILLPDNLLSFDIDMISRSSYWLYTTPVHAKMQEKWEHESCWAYTSSLYSHVDASWEITAILRGEENVLGILGLL